MIRTVLDANVFASALINPAGTPGRIVAALLENRAFDLLISPPILEELRRILAYPRVRHRIRLSDAELERWLRLLPLRAIVVGVTTTESIVAADPDDDPYLLTAREGLADHVVSGDHHLLDLRLFEGIRILSPRQFLDSLQQGFRDSAR